MLVLQNRVPAVGREAERLFMFASLDMCALVERFIRYTVHHQHLISKINVGDLSGTQTVVGLHTKNTTFVTTAIYTCWMFSKQEPVKLV